LIAGMAGLVAGAMSMAAGEYVSVHSQADTERADLDIERVELKTDNKGEHKELTSIYIAPWARSYSRETGCSATDGARRVGRPRQR